MKKFPVAIQLYSVRHEAEANLFGTLKKIKAMGYDGVEFAGLCGHKPEEVREMCESIGLVPLSAHVPYQDMVKDPEGVLGAYQAVGCRYIAVPYLTPELRPGTEAFPEVIKNVAMLGEVCNKLGMTLLYHNHDFEFVKLDGKYALDVLYDEVPASLLQTELDMCWVNVGGEEPSSYLLKYSGRAPVLHLKDFVGSKSNNMYQLIGIDDKKEAEKAEKFAFRPVGYGKQDFPKILAAAEQAGVQWVVVEQDQPTEENTPLECAEMSRRYLTGIGC